MSFYYLLVVPAPPPSPPTHARTQVRQLTDVTVAGQSAVQSVTPRGHFITLAHGSITAALDLSTWQQIMIIDYKPD